MTFLCSRADGGILKGVLCTPRDDGRHSCSRMLTAPRPSTAADIRRVDVKRGGATAASSITACPRGEAGPRAPSLWGTAQFREFVVNLSFHF